jgi:hypothetical protein
MHPVNVATCKSASNGLGACSAATVDADVMLSVNNQSTGSPDDTRA